eukprot:scaffold45341_cov56-Attheya_sp.AAC.3
MGTCQSTANGTPAKIRKLKYDHVGIDDWDVEQKNDPTGDNSLSKDATFTPKENSIVDQYTAKQIDTSKRRKQISICKNDGTSRKPALYASDDDSTYHNELSKKPINSTKKYVIATHGITQEFPSPLHDPASTKDIEEIQDKLDLLLGIAPPGKGYFIPRHEANNETEGEVTKVSTIEHFTLEGAFFESTSKERAIVETSNTEAHTEMKSDGSGSDGKFVRDNEEEITGTDNGEEPDEAKSDEMTEEILALLYCSSSSPHGEIQDPPSVDSRCLIRDRPDPPSNESAKTVSESADVSDPEMKHSNSEQSLSIQASTPAPLFVQATSVIRKESDVQVKSAVRQMIRQFNFGEAKLSEMATSGRTCSGDKMNPPKTEDDRAKPDTLYQQLDVNARSRSNSSSNEMDQNKDIMEKEKPKSAAVLVSSNVKECVSANYSLDDDMSPVLSNSSSDSDTTSSSSSSDSSSDSSTGDMKSRRKMNASPQLTPGGLLPIHETMTMLSMKEILTLPPPPPPPPPPLTKKMHTTPSTRPTPTHQHITSPLTGNISEYQRSEYFTFNCDDGRKQPFEGTNNSAKTTSSLDNGVLSYYSKNVSAKVLHTSSTQGKSSSVVTTKSAKPDSQPEKQSVPGYSSLLQLVSETPSILNAHVTNETIKLHKAEGQIPPKNDSAGRHERQPTHAMSLTPRQLRRKMREASPVRACSSPGFINSSRVMNQELLEVNHQYSAPSSPINIVTTPSVEIKHKANYTAMRRAKSRRKPSTNEEELENRDDVNEEGGRSENHPETPSPPKVTLALRRKAGASPHSLKVLNRIKKTNQERRLIGVHET